MEFTQELRDAIAGITTHIDEALAARVTAEAKIVKELDDRLAALEAYRVDLEAKLESAEKLYLPGVESMASTGDTKKFSWGRMAKLVAAPKRFEHQKEYGYEVDVWKHAPQIMSGIEDVEMKTAINAGTGASGAFLIPTELMAELIPVLEARSIAMQLGVTALNGLNGVVQWTKNAGGVTAAYIDTETEATGAESVPTFSQIELRPHVMGSFVPLTWSMLNQPAMALDAWVRGRIAVKLALLEDNSIFQGDSNESQPRGIVNTTGISTMNWSTNPGQPIFSSDSTTTQNITRGLRLHVKDLMDNNAFEGAERLGWALSPSALYAMSTTRDADGRDIFLPTDQSQAMPQRLIGYPALSSSQLEQTGNTAEFLLFGDFAQVINAHWGVMAFASSEETETNFRKLRTTIRGVWAHDVGVLEPLAFSNASNFNIANALT